ncbi:MAG: hypothetical protein ACE3JN_08570 [Ectobacillus sp.]
MQASNAPSITKIKVSKEATYVILATGAITEIAETIGVRTKTGTEPRI